jgi:hypothetical protein
MHVKCVTKIMYVHTQGFTCVSVWRYLLFWFTDGIVLGQWWSDMASNENTKFEAVDKRSSEYKEVKDIFTDVSGKQVGTIVKVSSNCRNCNHTFLCIHV